MELIITEKKIKEIDFEYDNLSNIPTVLHYFNLGEKFNILINNEQYK